MVKPSARSAYIAPRLTPLITCWSRTSQKVTCDPRAPVTAGCRARVYAAPRYDGQLIPRLRALRRRSFVSVLMDDVVVRVLRVVPVLKHAHDLRQHVAVLIEGDFALQRLELGGLHGVADVGAIDLLAALGNALDGVE